MFWLLLAVANPGGSPRCGAADDLSLFSYESAGHDLTLACDNGDCTLTSSAPFMGVLLHVKEGTFRAVPDGLRQFDACLTHKSRLNVATLAFAVAQTSIVDVTVVYGKNGNKHRAATLSQHVPVVDTNIFVHIVGAGAGGLAAARWLHANNVNFAVYERGGYDASTFTVPIRETSIHCDCFQFNHVAYTSPVNTVHYGGVGGTQNYNGAVYSPGTPEDLAASTGVSLTAARDAQRIVADYVFHTEHNMMWECLTATCDERSVTATNVDMKRRSIAYDLDEAILARIEQKVVTGVTFEKITFEGSEVTLRENDRVIVAAGALTTPALLGMSTFEGWNHYYTFGDVPNEKPARQAFYYDGDYEYNIAFAGITWLNISMHMKPTVRERYTVGEDRVHPDGVGNDAYHYAGTVPHTRFNVGGRLYVGEASALKTPFNCHTSMPAAAAGVMAAQAAVGVLHVDVEQAQTEKGASVPVAAAFVAGSILIVVGVGAHVLKFYTAHIIIMPVAVLTIIAAALSAGNVHRSEQHASLGRAVIVWLCVQAAGGVYAMLYRELGIYHRISGWLVLVLVIATVATAATKSDAWEHGATYEALSYATAGAIGIVLAASIAKGVPPR